MVARVTEICQEVTTSARGKNGIDYDEILPANRRKTGRMQKKERKKMQQIRADSGEKRLYCNGLRNRRG